MLLMGLPVAGFILAIVWACGGTNNVHRRNIARAMLILMAIGIILGILLSSAIISMVAGLCRRWAAAISCTIGSWA
jgi:hypothetical protein